MDAVALLKAVEKLYATALEQDEWLGALESVADVLRVGAGHVILIGGDEDDPTRAVGARVHEVDLNRLVFSGGEADGALDFAELPAGALVKRRSLVADADFTATEYYNDIVRPLNGFHSVFSRNETSSAGFALAICRPPNGDDFTSTEMAVMRALLPHISNAVEFGNKLRRAEHRSAIAESVLDQMETGVILTDAGSRPVAINAEAARIVGENDGLSIRTDGLAAATHRTTEMLRLSIAAIAAEPGFSAHELGAAVPPPSSGATRLVLERPSQRAPLLATLLPMAGLGGGSASGAVALFVKEADAPVQLDRSVIAKAFRLTAREAEVTCLLAEGLDLAATAIRLSISVGTARNHLKRVFEKTDTHNQAALVALARGYASAKI